MITIPKSIKIFITDADWTLFVYKNNPFYSSWDALGMCLSTERKKEWFIVRDKDKYPKEMDRIDSLSLPEEIKLEEKRKIEGRRFRKDLELLKGYGIAYFKEKIFSIPYTKGAKKFFRNIQKNKLKGSISAGIDFIIEKAAYELKMNFFSCPNLYNLNGVFIGGGKAIVNLRNKKEIFLAWCSKYNVDPKGVCYFGDNLNCVNILESCFGIAVNPENERVEKAAKYSVKDFCEIKLE
ncbi:MAG: HAD hydrolase family protein [Candidatus Pacearchaeota archaeon]